MNRIGLKVNGIWCVLPQDVSISIEEQNPLFSDSGSFSYPIELSISQNRELFKSIDSPQGRIRPQDLDGLPFELWFDGVMLLYGSTETDEDLDIDEDKCSINLVSGNGDFQSKIEGMQCTDVPLLGDIFLGYTYPESRITFQDPVASTWWEKTIYYDEVNNMDFQACNVSEAYSPDTPFCNIRVCVKRTDGYDKRKEMPYHELDAERPWSGICFYVAYFLDCLFYHLGYVVKENHMKNVEDMMRLAFITTKCEHRYGSEEKITGVDSIKIGKYIDCHFSADDVSWKVLYFLRKEVYATEKNFPETDVSSVLEALFNAFGLKILVDENKNSVSLYFVRDILRDGEIINTSMNIVRKSISYNKTRGVKLTYGVDDDTAFKYDDWKNVMLMDYKTLVGRDLNPYDKSCYINPATGNKYRIKVNEDAETESELYPVLFEVAQFNDYIIGEEYEDMEELQIGFSPLIENDLNFRNEQMSSKVTQQTLAYYVDSAETGKLFTEKTMKFWEGHHGWFFGTDDYWIKSHQLRYMDYEGESYSLLEHDSGFTLGVMRGAGSGAKTEDVLVNYDGNGNNAWVVTVDKYSTTADTMDAYGNRYDYNGTVEGGVANQQNSISLKTHIQTAQELGLKDKDGNSIDWGINGTAAKRGLADRFMSEYMHFLLNRKTVSMDVDTTLSQLTSLSWFKQLRINDTVGRLKSRSYTLTNSGVSDMNIELYTTN